MAPFWPFPRCHKPSWERMLSKRHASASTYSATGGECDQKYSHYIVVMFSSRKSRLLRIPEKSLSTPLLLLLSTHPHGPGVVLAQEPVHLLVRQGLWHHALVHDIGHPFVNQVGHPLVDYVRHSLVDYVRHTFVDHEGIWKSPLCHIAVLLKQKDTCPKLCSVGKSLSKAT